MVALHWEKPAFQKKIEYDVSTTLLGRSVATMSKHIVVSFVTISGKIGNFTKLAALEGSEPCCEQKNQGF